MLKSHLAAYQKAATIQISDRDLNLAQFILTAQQSAFCAKAQEWAIAPPQNVSNPHRFRKTCATIVKLIETGYDANANDWWSIAHWNFKCRLGFQLDLQWLGNEIESLPIRSLAFQSIRKEFLTFVEIFCGQNWRQQFAKVQRLAAPVAQAA